jgi:hypothetical protein
MSTAMVDKPDVGWSSIESQDALQPRAIVRGEVRRGV